MPDLFDDYEPDSDGPPTRDIKPPRTDPAVTPLKRRPPGSMIDLDAPDRILDDPALPAGRPICA